MTSYFKTLFASLFNEEDTEDLAGQKNEDYEIPYEKEEVNVDPPSADINEEAQLCEVNEESKNYVFCFLRHFKVQGYDYFGGSQAVI